MPALWMVLGVALAVAAVADRGETASSGSEDRRMQAERALDPSPAPYRVTRAPRRGQRLITNPPVFVWLPVAGMHDYVFQYGRDPELRDRSTVTLRQPIRPRTVRAIPAFAGGQEGEITFTPRPATMRVLPEPLGPGAWYWRYGYDAGEGVGLVFSSTWEFTIAPDAVAVPFPDIQEVVARAARGRPRMWVTPDTLPRLRELGRGELREQLAGLLRACEPYLGEPLLAEPEFLPEGEAWAPAYTRVFRTTRPFIAGMARCAEAYLLSGDRRFGDEAKRRLLHLVSWDPQGSTNLGHNDEVGTEIVRVAPRVYDYIHDLLTPEERARCLDCFAARLPQLYHALRARPFEVNPFESHAMGYYLTDLTEACIALAGELDVSEWLEYCLMMLWAPFFPPYGGEDGGWCEGPSYWGWTVNVFVRTFRLVEQVTGVPIHQREWLRRTGYYKLYGNPPYAKMSPFGDGQSNPPAGVESVWELALTFDDPYLKWYAEQRSYAPGGLEAFLLHDRDQALDSRPPTDLPQARCFPDVGLVALHSDLAHGDRNVQVLLRSSPYGSISHSYADQNAFTLDAFGEPLAIASGYYPYYNSPHHRGWTWHTKAANCIGVNGEGQAIRDWDAKGRIARFETNDYWHYALGDATAAYRGRLLRFRRHIAFLRPQAPDLHPVVIIYDDVSSPEAATFQWWLHALEEMRVEPERQKVTIERGGAAVDVLLLAPDGLSFSQTDQFSVPPEGEYPNQWHLTAETTATGETCHFLAILLPRRGTEDGRQWARLLSGEAYLGAEVIAQGRRHIVAFRTSEAGTGPVQVGDLALTGDIGAASWDREGRPLGRAEVALSSP